MAVVLPERADEPLTVLDDRGLGAILINQDPGPLGCLDAVLYHHGPANVPIFGFLGHELVPVLQCNLSVHVVLLPGGVDRAERSEHSMCHDLSERDCGVMLGDRMLVVHAGEDLVSAQKDLLGEVALLTIDGYVVVVLDLFSVDPQCERLGHCVRCRR